MAGALSLPQSNVLKFKHTFPVPLPAPRLIPNFHQRLILTNPKFSKNPISTCFLKLGHHHSSPTSVTKSSSSSKHYHVTTKTQKNSLEVILNSVSKALKTLKMPAVCAILLGLLLMCNPNSAFAASGGRMGGSLFPSHSLSFPSSSCSASSDGPSSRGGGGGGGGFHVRLDVEMGAGAGCTNSRSYTKKSPRFDFSYSAPYDGPSPFGGGDGGWFNKGAAVGVGVGAASSFFLILMGFAAFVILMGFVAFVLVWGCFTDTPKTSVIELQVGLLGMGRTLENDLNRIANAADTSSQEGLSSVLTETTHALLCHLDYCISGYSAVDVKQNMDDGEKCFNQLSIEEWGKFDEVTLSNVNNIKRQSNGTQRSNEFSNEHIVVTILVAAEGVHKVPSINGNADLKEALQKLGSIPSSKILAVEILWTPQNESDTLSKRELLEDYPLLRPLST